MARDILFKAKRLDNGEWVMGGSIIQFLDDGVRSFYMPQFNEKCICEHDEVTDDILKFENTRFYKVDGDTICQYTGLTDKHGRKIFENDVVRCVDYNSNSEFMAVVEFGNPNSYYSWGYQLRHIKGDEPNLDILLWIHMEEVGATCEVIGNTFDNPELLGGGVNG